MGIEGIRDFRDLKAEEGEKESVDFGVLDLKGLPANAWVRRFIARVLFVVRLSSRVYRSEESV